MTSFTGNNRILSGSALILSLGLVVGCASGGPTETPPEPGPTAAEPSDPDALLEFDEACPAIEPRELPSGAPPGEPEIREAADTEPPATIWGAGADQVVQAGGVVALALAGDDGFDTSSWAEDQIVEVDGVDRFVIPVGDPGQIQILFVVEGCPYINWVGPGLTIEDALDYASRF